MADLAGILQKASQTPEKIKHLALSLEKGQAITPLVQQAEALDDFGRIAGRLTLLLIGMTSEARAKVLTWLIGPQHQSVSVKLSEPTELLEIQLQERGYALEAELAGRMEFADAETFIKAFQGLLQNNAVDDSLLEPIRLGLTAPQPLCDLTILVPGNPHIATAAPRILSTISQRTALLVLAAPADHAWTAEEFSAISVLSENTQALWPVLVTDEQHPANPQALLHVVSRLAAPTLPLSAISGPNSTLLPDFITGSFRHPIRLALALAAFQRHGQRVLDMIAERCDTELRQLESRHKRETRLERSADVSPRTSDGKGPIEQFRVSFNDELGRLSQTIKENSRRTMLKNGAVGQILEQLLSSLQPDDLEREDGRKVIKLSLKPEVLASFRNRIGKAIRQQVDEDCILIRDSLELQRSTAEQALQEGGALTCSLSLATPDHRAIWDVLSEMLQVDLKYKGELPKRGFWQRMAEGRRIVFVAMMLMSLVGGFVGFNIRQAGAFGFVFLILFIGAVIYTYGAWRKDEDENLDKEIEKVRENLQTEFSRVLNEIGREKQTRMQQAVDDIKRDAAGRLEQAQKEAAANKAKQAEGERRDARAKLKVIDQRLKEMRPLLQNIGKLQQELAGLGGEVQAELVRLSKAEQTA